MWGRITSQAKLLIPDKINQRTMVHENWLCLPSLNPRDRILMNNPKTTIPHAIKIKTVIIIARLNWKTLATETLPAGKHQFQLEIRKKTAGVEARAMITLCMKYTRTFTIICTISRSASHFRICSILLFAPFHVYGVMDSPTENSPRGIQYSIGLIDTLHAVCPWNLASDDFRI